ncbi:hypothetical protein HMPREF9103_01209 [Lentilactobacillus parafarraginis F0439]|uniref:Uncharacterized protein n=1 Tax=Lentilactobacillus parafarraginis F0439 TaxID=797515 RepID=G9ZNA6_9LACO|nr:hypothetical protein HMPREF9103_01209 [Lentilactobacillus parafarraginis F0439]
MNRNPKVTNAAAIRNDSKPGMTLVIPKLATTDAKIVPIIKVNMPINVIRKFSSIRSLPLYLWIRKQFGYE